MRDSQNADLKAAFTLIELLVVIAIIGVLATIVFVVLTQARERARIARGMNFSLNIQHSLGSEAIGIWTFDEGSGEAVDTSGFGNNGTLTNGAAFNDDTPNDAVGTGSARYSVSFDGINDYIRVLDSNILDIGTGDFTIAAWVKLTSLPSSWRGIVNKGGWGTVGYGISVSIDNKFAIDIQGASGSNQHVYADTFVTDKWTLLVAAFDRDDKVHIYMDGVLGNSASIVGNSGSLANAYHFTIGSYFTPNYYFPGLIDDVRIFSSALSAYEIQKLYAEGIKGHNDVVASAK